ncbi:hypothetical protein N8382_08905 [Polaribacter sp.]|nr:hypothetical protein [Polaribacter sp.]
MKKFLVIIIAFTFIIVILGDIVIRVFKLVPDIPERYVDKHNIQKYKPGQSGYYTKAEKKWNVNEFGWLGVHNITKDSTITIIGDSFIENIMNPIECNQGNLLKKHIPDYSFFEAGRSGISFIETLEISRILDLEIKPKYQLIYLSPNDFTESISEISSYNDRYQLSIDNQKLNVPKLKSPFFKKILYNVKVLYFTYLKYPVFVEKQNKGETVVSFDKSLYDQLIKYCSENYDLSNLIFVMHPEMNDQIIELVQEYGFKIISLNSNNDKSWKVGPHDSHWSCYGHSQVASQIASKLGGFIKNENLLLKK